MESEVGDEQDAFGIEDFDQDDVDGGVREDVKNFVLYIYIYFAVLINAFSLSWIKWKDTSKYKLYRRKNRRKLINQSESQHGT